MSYQAVIRDASNELVASQSVGMQISILQGSASGTVVYTETQTPTTNANGLVSIAIGEGSTNDDFSSIDWANGPYFVKTETDPNGGSDYSITGTSQLLSVPYAMHAKTAENVLSEIDVDAMVANNGYVTTLNDDDATNEIQNLSVSATGDTLYLQNGGFVIMPGISAANEDGGAVDANEIIDIDGNNYTYVIIGNQKWMVENLRTSKYSNGDTIPNVTDNSEWQNLNNGAYCWYDNDNSNEDTYGKIYNWFAVADSRNLCPVGWHVPSDGDWTVLTDYLTANGHIGSEGTALKAIEGWNDDGNGTDDFKFRALPSPGRFNSGYFCSYCPNQYGDWWSSTESNKSNERAWCRELATIYDSVNRFDGAKYYGMYVRCLEDSDGDSGNGDSGGSGAYPEGTVHCTGTPTEVVDVTSPSTGKTWMDRNLGATQAATSSTDSLAYGDLYQWGRAADGHQCRNSATITTLSSTDEPGHDDFITSGFGSNYDWRSPQNDNLWQGANGINNPCPSGYRLPTNAELDAEHESWSSDDAAGAFSSPLKLPVAGFRSSNGSLYSVGSYGSYWSSRVDGTVSNYLDFFSFAANMDGSYRANSISVRCLKDSDGDSGNGDDTGDNTELPTITTASVTSITDSSAVTGGTIDTNGGAAITASGVVWDTVSNPTLDSNLGVTIESATSGIFVSNITGLSASTTYYIKAYATNSEGTAYAVEDTFTTTSSGGGEMQFNIWQGPEITFTKSAGADPTLKANQDSITPSVSITRGNSGGEIYNIIEESQSTTGLSPSGTEWAIGEISEIENLNFASFRSAVGKPKQVVGKSLVLHIINEDVYISVEFKSWGQGRNGDFSYERSTQN
jgi:uncharacterized protein (TIGR02145 family)